MQKKILERFIKKKKKKKKLRTAKVIKRKGDRVYSMKKSWEKLR